MSGLEKPILHNGTRESGMNKLSSNSYGHASRRIEGSMPDHFNSHIRVYSLFYVRTSVLFPDRPSLSGAVRALVPRAPGRPGEGQAGALQDGRGPGRALRAHHRLRPPGAPGQVHLRDRQRGRRHQVHGAPLRQGRRGHGHGHVGQDHAGTGDGGQSDLVPSSCLKGGGQRCTTVLDNTTTNGGRVIFLLVCSEKKKKALSFLCVCLISTARERSV